MKIETLINSILNEGVGDQINKNIDLSKFKIEGIELNRDSLTKFYNQYKDSLKSVIQGKQPNLWDEEDIGKITQAIEKKIIAIKEKQQTRNVTDSSEQTQKEIPGTKKLDIEDDDRFFYLIETKQAAINLANAVAKKCNSVSSLCISKIDQSNFEQYNISKVIVYAIRKKLEGNPQDLISMSFKPKESGYGVIDKLKDKAFILKKPPFEIDEAAYNNNDHSVEKEPEGEKLIYKVKSSLDKTMKDERKEITLKEYLELRYQENLINLHLEFKEDKVLGKVKIDEKTQKRIEAEEKKTKRDDVLIGHLKKMPSLETLLGISKEEGIELEEKIAHGWKKKDGVWKDGTFISGLFEGEVWEDGTFKKGIWEGGTWKNGTWLDGNWNNVDNTVWKNGTWKNGTWHGGTWENGVWENGSWVEGTWENGTWKKVNKFKLGLWYKGTWKNGTWEDGTWKNGTWQNGTFEDGVWEYGLWKNGTFKGDWWGGRWFDGTWEGKKWRGGYIYDPEQIGNFKEDWKWTEDPIKGIKKAFVNSPINPKEYFKGTKKDMEKTIDDFVAESTIKDIIKRRTKI